MEIRGNAATSDQETFNIVEIRFKNARKEFYRNENLINLYIGDVVVVDADNPNNPHEPPWHLTLELPYAISGNSHGSIGV